MPDVNYQPPPAEQGMYYNHPGGCAHAAALRRVLDERERELLAVKGACSNADCRLHRAHSGPCDVAVRRDRRG